MDNNTLKTTSFAANSARCPRKVSMASTADDTESTGTFFCAGHITASFEPVAPTITNRQRHDVDKAVVPPEPEAVVETAASKLRISRSDQLSYSGQGEAELLPEPANDVKLPERPGHAEYLKRKAYEENRRHDPSVREYRRNHARIWIAKRRAEFFHGKSCVLCGSTVHLELDHLDPSQKVDHRIWSWSEARRLDEISKCRVLCRRCHTTRHADERRKPIVHGTRNAYDKKRCRCELCKQQNRDRVQAQRERKCHLLPATPATPAPAALGTQGGAA